MSSACLFGEKLFLWLWTMLLILCNATLHGILSISEKNSYNIISRGQPDTFSANLKINYVSS